MVKKILALLLCFSFAFIGLGCQNTKTKAVEGAVIGGVLGAAAGGIIGHQGHHGAEGAAIGAAIGAIGGGVIGAQMPKEQQAQTAGTAQEAANPEQMSILQVVELSKKGTAENAIIEKIRSTNSKFNLSPADIEYLKKEGVSQKVIDAMQVK